LEQTLFHHGGRDDSIALRRRTVADVATIRQSMFSLVSSPEPDMRPPCVRTIKGAHIVNALSDHLPGYALPELSRDE
jgi:hypothetical protein